MLLEAADLHEEPGSVLYLNADVGKGCIVRRIVDAIDGECEVGRERWRVEGEELLPEAGGERASVGDVADGAGGVGVEEIGESGLQGGVDGNDAAGRERAVADLKRCLRGVAHKLRGRGHRTRNRQRSDGDQPSVGEGCSGDSRSEGEVGGVDGIGYI